MSYKSIIQESFPLFYYQLNEHSGDFKEVGGRASAIASSASIGYNAHVPNTYFNGVDFNGIDDYIDLGIATSPNTFSVEFWLVVKPSSSTNPHILAHAQVDLGTNANQPFSIKINPAGTQITANFSSGLTSAYDLTLTAALTEGTVYHIAVTRDGLSGACILYMNGSVVASGVLTHPLSIYNQNWRLGAAIESGAGIGTTFAACTIAELAIYDAVIAEDVFNHHYNIGYTSTFRPPANSDPYLNLTSLLVHAREDFSNPGVPIDIRGKTLEFQGTAGFSTVTKVFGATSFGLGSAGNIRAPSGTANFGTGDFTMETWVYFENNTKPYASVFGNGLASFGSGCRALMLYGVNGSVVNQRSRLIFVGYGIGVNNTVLVGETIIKPGRWYHVALCRFSGVTKLYVNGDLDAQANDTNSHDFSLNGFLIGKNGWDGINGYVNGYVDEIRITKGVCRYTTNFEIGATPFPDFQLFQHKFSDYDSKLDQVAVLLHGDKFFDMSNNALPLTTAGGFSISPIQPKIGTSSFRTTGNIDYAYLSSPTALKFDTPTWTAELWIKPTIMQDSMILDWRPDATEGFYPAIGMSSSGNIRVRINGVNFDTHYAIEINEWWHIAVVSKNSVIRVFINGVPASTFSITSLANSNRLLIAADAMSRGTAGGFIGYMSEIRITKNVARYLGPFQLQDLPFRDRSNNTWTQSGTIIPYDSIDIQFPLMVPDGTDVVDPLNIDFVVGTFKISGRAIRADGQAATFVSIHSTDGLFVEKKTPAANGDYEFDGLDGTKQYYLLVDADGNYTPKAIGPIYPDVV